MLSGREGTDQDCSLAVVTLVTFRTCASQPLPDFMISTKVHDLLQSLTPSRLTPTKVLHWLGRVVLSEQVGPAKPAQQAQRP
jgi:hypothetical protein